MVIDRSYLEFCGFRLNDEGDDVIFVPKHYNVIPTIRCVADDEVGYSFILSFFVSKDSYKFQKQFTFDEFDAIINSYSELFTFFSLTKSFLEKVRRSRMVSAKPKKKRNWPLPFKWAKIKKAFGLERFPSSTSFDADEAHYNMHLAVVKAAQSFSNSFFEAYYDAYKAVLRSEGKVGRVSRKTAYRAFKEAVEKCQGL